MIQFEIKKMLKQKYPFIPALILILFIMFFTESISTRANDSINNVSDIYTINTWAHFHFISADNVYEGTNDIYDIEMKEAVLNRDSQKYLQVSKDFYMDKINDFRTSKIFPSKRIEYIDYILNHNLSLLDSVPSMNQQQSALQYLNETMFVNGLYTIPIFIVLISGLFIDSKDKNLYLQPKKKSSIFHSKALANTIFCFSSIVVAIIITYVYYGITNHFSDLRMPTVFVNTNKMFLGSAIPDFTYISGYLYLGLMFFIIALYTTFLSYLMETIKKIIKDKYIVSIVGVMIVLGFFILKYQSFNIGLIGYLLPFTYSNPVFALQGEALFVDYHDYTSFLPAGIKDGFQNIATDYNIFYANGVIVLVVSIIILIMIFKLFLNKKDLLR